MKVRLKPNLLVVTAESAEEQGELAAWTREVDGFAVRLQNEQTVRFASLGLRPDACREPINVSSHSPDAAIRLISNFADTPFELDGRHYGSVEAFWQGLKFPDEAHRLEIAPLHGMAAKQAGAAATESDTIIYEGRTIRVGTVDHWRLMSRACSAKFDQHQAARQALLGTGERPLMHRMRRDSRNIPGVVMADIWMKIRRALRP